MGLCATHVIVDGTRCQMTRDCKGQFGPCNLEEVAWYKTEMSLGKHNKPCCNTCIQPWQSWETKRNHKVENFMKYRSQICEGCTVTQQIADVPVVTAAAVAVVSAESTPHHVQFVPPPPPRAQGSHSVNHI